MSDRDDVRCARWQEAISAAVDGEDPGVDPRLVSAHLARCAGCRNFELMARRTGRALAVTEAPAIPDLSRRITKLAALADRASHWSVARAALAVVAVEILLFAVPDLAARDGAAAPVHDARHLGAFTAAYGVALLVVVARPARARTVLPVACVLAGALVITAVVDLIEGNIPLAGEASHLPEILSVALVWLLTKPRRRSGQPAPRQERLPLRAVAADGEVR